MGDREVYLEEDLQCDICGKYGAYDFYGDCICQECLERLREKGGEDGKDN